MFTQAPPGDPDVQSLQMQGSSQTGETEAAPGLGVGLLHLGKVLQTWKGKDF